MTDIAYGWEGNGSSNEGGNVRAVPPEDDAKGTCV
jgi:hypothetical protein